MGQVTISLNGRNYRLQCGEGEETRVRELADYVKAKLDTLLGEFGSAGQERLLVATLLVMADELFEARAKPGAQHNAADNAARSRTAKPRRAEPAPSDTDALAGASAELKPDVA